jgi:hypothetical protein
MRHGNSMRRLEAAGGNGNDLLREFLHFGWLPNHWVAGGITGAR